MAAGSSCFAGSNKLHIDVNTAFFRVHPLIDHMFDQSVGRTFHWHLVVFDNIQPVLIFTAKFLTGFKRLLVEINFRALRFGPLALDCICKCNWIHNFLTLSSLGLRYIIPVHALAGNCLFQT